MKNGTLTLVNGAEQTSEEYREGLVLYREAVRSLPDGAVVDDDRLEHGFECLRDWSVFCTFAEVSDWFEVLREECDMTVESIPLREIRGWSVEAETGNIFHESGEFFTVQGIRVRHSGSREVGDRGWDQPIITQVGYDGGIAGLLRKRFSGVPHYLINAKAEPGNPGLLQISPSLLATFSNLKQAHRGDRPLFADLFERPDEFSARLLYRCWITEDGGRLNLKRNLAMILEVAEDMEVECPAGYRWLSMYQLKACMKRHAWVNPHVRAIVAHL